MSVPDESLLGKVAQQLNRPPAYEASAQASILSIAAASYGWRSDGEEVTQPTGFDPEAARLFEAMVEAAFLVATADGNFDTAEQAAFHHVVVTACAGLVLEGQVSALLADLADQLSEDGLDKRIQMVCRAILRSDQAREVLRMAALLAAVSGGVSQVERQVLSRLASHFDLPEGAVDTAINEAKSALAG